MMFFGKENKADELKVVIIGAGEVGFHIAQRLAQEKKQVVVIDSSQASLKRLDEYSDVQTIHGSGSSPRVLDEAGVADADIFLAVTDSDEINIIACLFANVLAPDMLKLARIRNEEYTLYQDALSKEFLNVGMVINPEIEIVKTIDRMITAPGAVEFNEFAGGRLNMLALRLNESPLVGKKLMELRSADSVGFVVAAIVRGEKLIIPKGNDKIEQGDLIYYVCQDEDRRQVRALFGYKDEPIKDIMVIGGGNIGLRLATLLENKGYRVKLLERDEERCLHLAEQLNSVIVLKGDGTDQDFLREENVSNMDMVVSLTGDEETNILSSLLSKNMGARTTITRVNKSAYLPIVRAIGIEHSVSPRLSAVNSILHYVRQGKVISSVSIKGDEAEVLEAVAQENSAIVGKPLKDIFFPKGSLLLCILHDDYVVIPSGDSVIEPHDRIVIISTRKALTEVEQALMVKLESL